MVCVADIFKHFFSGETIPVLEDQNMKVIETHLRKKKNKL
jgi:hypothetical protein